MYQDKPGMFQSFFEALFYLALFALLCLGVAGIAGLAGTMLFELLSDLIIGRV